MSDKLLVHVGGEDWNLHTRGGGTRGLKTDVAELLSQEMGVPIAADDADLQAFLHPAEEAAMEPLPPMDDEGHAMPAVAPRSAPAPVQGPSPAAARMLARLLAERESS